MSNPRALSFQKADTKNIYLWRDHPFLPQLWISCDWNFEILSQDEGDIVDLNIPVSLIGWLVSAMLTLIWENSLIWADAAMSCPFFMLCNSSPILFACMFLDCLSSMCRPWYFKELQLVVSAVDYFSSHGLLDLKSYFIYIHKKILANSKICLHPSIPMQ